MNLEEKCSRCGETHKNLPMSYSVDAPYQYELLGSVLPQLLPEEETLVFLSSEQCVMGNWFFVRGCLEVPILDTEESFIWRIWVLIRRDDFDRILRLWENPDREYERPYKGWLATKIPGYKDTMHLSARVQTRGVGECSLIEMERSKHKLAREQQEGITRARAKEIAEMLWHEGKESA
jgi:hypothetical protein